MSSAPAGPGMAAAAPEVKVYYGKPMQLNVPMQLDVSRVLACLYEKDVKFRSINTFQGRPMPADLIRLQASTRAQVIGFEDGPIFLHDSRAICRYIAEKYADRGNKYLLGRDLLERASIEQWLKSEEQSFDPPSWELIFYIAFGPHANNSAPDRALITQSEQKLAKILDIYEHRLGQSRYLAGDEFTLADLNHLPNSYYLATTSYRDYLFDERVNVQRWFEDISGRPSWTKVVELTTEETGLEVRKEPTAIEKDASKPRKPSIEVKKDVASRQEPKKVFLVPQPTSLVSVVSPSIESAEPRYDTQDVAPTTPEKAPTSEQATKAAPPTEETATAREASAQPALEAQTPRADKPSTQPPPATPSTESAKPQYDTPQDVGSTTPEKAPTSKQATKAAPPTKETATAREASSQPALEAKTPRGAKPSTQPSPATQPTDEKPAVPQVQAAKEATPTTQRELEGAKSQQQDVSEQFATRQLASQTAIQPPKSISTTKPAGPTARIEQVGAQQEARLSSTSIQSFASDTRDTSEMAKVSPALFGEKGTLPNQPIDEAAAKSQSISQQTEKTTQSTQQSATTKSNNETETIKGTTTVRQTITQQSTNQTKSDSQQLKLSSTGTQSAETANNLLKPPQTSEKSQLADKITRQVVEEAAAQSKSPASTTDKSTTETTSSSQTATRTKSVDNTTSEQVQAQEKYTPSLIPSDPMVGKEAAGQSKKSASTTEKSFMETSSYSQTAVRREPTNNTTTEKSTTKTAISSQMTTRTENTDKTTTEQAQSQERQPRDQTVGKSAPKAPDNSKEPDSSDTQSSTQTTNNSKRDTAALTNAKGTTETIQTTSLSNGKLSSYKASTSETSKDPLSAEKARSQEAQKAERSVAQSVEPTSPTGKSSPETRTPSGMTGQTPSISETTGTRNQSGAANSTESTQPPNSSNLGAKTDPSIDSSSK